jgi:hypothetical protein
MARGERDRVLSLGGGGNDDNGFDPTSASFALGVDSPMDAE